MFEGNTACNSCASVRVQPYPTGQTLPRVWFGYKSHSQPLSSVWFGYKSHSQLLSRVCFGYKSHSQLLSSVWFGYKSHSQRLSRVWFSYKSHSPLSSRVWFGYENHSQNHTLGTVWWRVWLTYFTTLHWCFTLVRPIVLRPYSYKHFTLIPRWSCSMQFSVVLPIKQWSRERQRYNNIFRNEGKTYNYELLCFATISSILLPPTGNKCSIWMMSHNFLSARSVFL